MNLDVFNSDPFHVTQLSQAMTLLPYVPTRIRELGLFAESGISTTTVFVEMEAGVLRLVPTAPRGAPGQVEGLQRRSVRPFAAVHLPQRVALLADEVQSLRAFGSQTELELATERMNKKLAIAKRNLDLTIEYQRIGAIKGKILDADGSTVITNLFTEFGVTQQTLNCALDVTTTPVFNKAITLKRMIEDTLGGTMMSGVRVLAHQSFIDALTTHAKFEASFQAQMASFNRADNRKGFAWTTDVTIEEYRGQINGVPFIEPGCAYAIPEGVPELFNTHYAPADMMDTINTDGLPYYASIEMLDHNKGLDILTQSNPLHLCNRPNAIIKLGINAAALA